MNSKISFNFIVGRILLAVAVGGGLLGIIVVVRGKFFLVSKNFINFLSSGNSL